MPLPRELEQFFIDLPPEHDPQGICESTNGSLDGGIAVTIARDCTAEACLAAECLMFLAILDPSGQILARRFKPHPSHYPNRDTFQASE